MRLVSLPLSQIRQSPFLPRRDFDERELMGLADSIRKNGIIQPICVRKREDGSYEMIAGERRLRAAKFAGLKEVPCVVQVADDRKAAFLSLIENLQRRDLNLFEEAEGIRALMNEWGLSQYETAVRLGKSQSTIANKLRLLRLNNDQKARIVAAGLSERHARAILRLVEDKERDDALNEIISKQLSVRETEEMIECLMNPPEEPPHEPQINQKPPIIREHVIRDFRIYVNTLTKAVDTIRRSGLDARTDKVENDSFIRYTVIIPKEKRKEKPKAEQLRFDL
ncbi:MAG: ParB/RepB/Spo0J family partition protein [Clostridia bacterium]|nr:ParB/RepB/Spo0J family partition protein [Clostridia bacterium]